MTTTELPPWGARARTVARRAGSASLLFLGLSLVVRLVGPRLDDATRETAAWIVAVPFIVAIATFLVAGVSWVVAEFWSGFRDPRPPR